MSDQSKMFSFRLATEVYDALHIVARKEGLEAGAYVQLLIRDAVAKSGVLSDAESDKIRKTDDLILRAVASAKEAFAAREFDEHFTLTVFRRLMKDPLYRRDYEDVVGGDAYATKLKGKFPLNMYLGWYIKNAVGADPLLDQSGKAKRASVKDEPIQSYTLLKLGEA